MPVCFKVHDPQQPNFPEKNTPDTATFASADSRDVPVHSQPETPLFNPQSTFAQDSAMSPPPAFVAPTLGPEADLDVSAHAFPPPHEHLAPASVAHGACETEVSMAVSSAAAFEMAPACGIDNSDHVSPALGNQHDVAAISIDAEATRGGGSDHSAEGCEASMASAPHHASAESAVVAPTLNPPFSHPCSTSPPRYPPPPGPPPPHILLHSMLPPHPFPPPSTPPPVPASAPSSCYAAPLYHTPPQTSQLLSGIDLTHVRYPPPAYPPPPFSSGIALHGAEQLLLQPVAVHTLEPAQFEYPGWRSSLEPQTGRTVRDDGGGCGDDDDDDDFDVIVIIICAMIITMITRMKIVMLTKKHEK